MYGEPDGNEGGEQDLEERIPFVGRQREREEIKAWFRTGRHRLVQIYGPPFTGKYRLAKQVVNELSKESRERNEIFLTYSLRCNKSTNSDDFRRSFSESMERNNECISKSQFVHFGLRQMFKEEKYPAYLCIISKIDNLRKDSLEKFIDICEHLLQTSMRVFLIVTSQVRIRFPYSMMPRDSFLPGMSMAESSKLLKALAPETDLSKHIEQIICNCCYLPGLIVESALLLNHPQHVVSVEDLLSMLRHPKSLLQFISHPATKTLEKFFERMSQNVKRNSTILSLFQGSFSKDAANFVLSQTEHDHSTSSKSMLELCDQSVVSYSSREERYQMSTFIHKILSESIISTPEINSARMRFVKFFGKTLEVVEQKVFVHGRDCVLGYLHGDFNNVRQLMEQTIYCTQEMFQVLMQTVVKAEELFTVCFSSREVAVFYEHLLEVVSVYGTPIDRAVLQWLIAQSMTHMKHRGNNEVDKLCCSAHAVLEINGPSYHLAAVKGLLGQTYVRQGNVRRGLRMLNDALDMLSLFEQTMEAKRRQITLWSHQAIAESFLGNYTESETILYKTLQIAHRECPYHPSIAIMVNTMGMNWERSGRSHYQAMRYYKDSLHERKKCSYFKPESLVPSLLNVALQLVRTGDYPAALKTLEEAMELRKQSGWTDYFTGLTLYYLGTTYMQTEEYQRAITNNEKALQIFLACTPRHFITCETLMNLAHCYLALQNEITARDIIYQAIMKYEECNDPDISFVPRAFRHCVLLGNAEQRKYFNDKLSKHLLSTMKENPDIQKLITDRTAINSENSNLSLDEKRSIYFSEFCSICKNRYGVFERNTCKESADNIRVFDMHDRSGNRESVESNEVEE